MSDEKRGPWILTRFPMHCGDYCGLTVTDAPDGPDGEIVANIACVSPSDAVCALRSLGPVSGAGVTP